MAKTHSTYVCQNCGRQTPRYFGRCPSCGEFNTMVEEIHEVSKTSGKKQRVVLPQSQPQRLGEISNEAGARLLDPDWRVQPRARRRDRAGEHHADRRRTGDRQIDADYCRPARRWRKHVGRVLYVSGEESVQQIKMRADRMELAAPTTCFC